MPKKNSSGLRGYLLIILFMISPILLTLTAILIASLIDVKLNEGSVPDCFGGEWLYAMSLSAIAAIVTIPVGILLLFLHTIRLLMLPLRERLKLKKEEEHARIEAEFGFLPDDPLAGENDF